MSPSRTPPPTGGAGARISAAVGPSGRASAGEVLGRPAHEIAAPAQAGLAPDPRGDDLDGPLGDLELSGDLLLRETVPDELEHLLLARVEGDVVVRLLAVREPRVAPHQLTRQRRIDHG